VGIVAGDIILALDDVPFTRIEKLLSEIHKSGQAKKLI
jgi:hypothetical protein